MLRGRNREQAALQRLVEQARSGAGAALVVRGQPGVGKTALLADLTEHTSRLIVLRSQGVESEAPLPFAALHRLLRPILGHLATVPTPQADALRAAFGEASANAGDRYLIFLATLSLLSEAAQDQPVLVVVDDAQWLDDASLAALLFTARRLQGEAVAMLFAARDDESEHFDPGDLPVLTITGVDDAAAGEIITDHLDTPVAAEVRAELLVATEGNPLGLVELTRALTVDQLSGRDRLPHRLPVTKAVESAFLDRYRRLSVPVQTLLLIAATDDSGRTSTVVRASSVLGADTDALDAAETSGLLKVGEGTLSLRHPLVRSAIYGAATNARRRQAHRALAAAMAGTPDEDRRAWHLAASVDEPDDEVVTALEQAAERARRRGGHEAATAAWSRAAELTLDPQARAQRLYFAAGSSLMAARPLETDQLARAALMDTTDPVLRADLLQLRGQVEWNTRSLDDGYGIVCEAAEAAAPHDPARARVLAMLAASLAAFGARSPNAPDPTAIATPIEPDAPAEARAAAWLLEGFSAVVSADWPTAAAAFRRAWDTPIDATAHPLLPPNLAIATMHLGDDARALMLHDLQLKHARHASAANMIEHALTRGAIVRIATGAWREAASAAQEALLLNRNLGLDELLAFPLSELALIAALRGDPEGPRYLHELERILAEHPLRGVVAGLVSGLRHWATARQNDVAPAAALHHLEQIDLPLLRGMAAIDRIETAVHADRRDLADDWIQELRSFAEGTDMAWAWASSYHGEAVLGGPDAEHHFDRALEWHTRSPRIPDRARTQLALGAYLRRNRRRSDAREPLREALGTFETLGAPFWAERAREELRASGETARRGTDVSTKQLTPQEAQVAAQVRQGLSNKEVAARLFVSPRTVDFHLRNIYTKLGITSRGGLVAHAADDPVYSGPPEAG